MSELYTPPKVIFTEEDKLKMGITVMTISSILIIAPLACHFIRTKNLRISQQLIGMFLGILVAVAGSIIDKYTDTNFRYQNHYRILSVYYSIMILRYIYVCDAYVFIKSLSQSLIISVIGWTASVTIFGFLLISFAGKLSTFKFAHWLLLGIIFAPIEMPSIMFDIERIKRIEVIMSCEAVFSTIMSTVCLNLMLGFSADLFSCWYQPICVFLRVTLFACGTGLVFGWLAAELFPKFAASSVASTLMLISANYMMFHIAQYMFACSGGLCCLTFVAMISRRRLQMPKTIERDVTEQIKIWYDCISTVVSFMCVCEALWPFIEIYDIMITAVSLALYICAMACRLMFFICISPILSRLGYGFNFKSMVTMVWCIRKGPLSFLMVSILVNDKVEEDIVPMYLLLLGLNYAFLVNLLNELFSWTALCLMGLAGDDVLQKKANILKALNYLEDKRKDQIAIMKLHRFYVNANWKVVNSCTMNLIEGKTSTEVRDDGMAFEKKPPFCKSCETEVEYQLSQTEHNNLLAALRLKVLHASRISFGKQFKKGFLDDGSIRKLNHLLDMALEAPDLIVKIEPILVLLRERHHNKYVEKLRLLLISFDKQDIKTNYTPKYSIYYKKMKDWWWQIFFDIVALVQFSFTVYYLINEYNLLTDLSNILCLILFYIEFSIGLLGSTTDTLKNGFVVYWEKHWHKLDFILLMLNTLDLFLIATKYHLRRMQGLEVNDSIIMAFTVWRLFRVLRIIGLVSKTQFLTVVYYDRHVAAKIVRAYNIGRGIVLAYEELDEILHTLASNTDVVAIVRNQLKDDRNIICKDMGIIEMLWPALSKNLKTRQAMLCTVWSMDNTMINLYKSGHMNDDEYLKLRYFLFNEWIKVKTMKIRNESNVCVLKEVDWLVDTKEVYEYLYERVKLRVWNAGDTIFNRGDVADGVIVIITGLFKVIYTPNSKMLHDLQHHGLLPVMDMIRHPKFDHPMEEYIFKGNSVGELSVMTGRAYCCDVVADIPSQGYVIPRQVLIDSLHLSPDPINGVFSQIWIHITGNLVRRLIRTIPLYTYAHPETLNEIVGRSFVAVLDAFSVFHLTDSIDDVILVEGTVTDFNTRIIYIAPCVIPRSSTKLIIPEHYTPYNFNVQPIMWIVPRPDLDPYDVFAMSQLISDLNNKNTYYLIKTGNRISLTTEIERVNKYRQEALRHNFDDSFHKYEEPEVMSSHVNVHDDSADDITLVTRKRKLDE